MAVHARAVDASARTAQRALLAGSAPRGAEPRSFRAREARTSTGADVVKVARGRDKAAEKLAIAHLRRPGTGPERTL
ncbi:MAG TPA: hypothetical protein VFS67_19060 [Polyangiaceae bacterium]|nr:hypothetical protein [Polyangiaceae bacterium]